MAKVYAVPEGFDFVTDFTKSFDDIMAQEKSYIYRLKKYCKTNSPSKDPIVGEIVKTPIADGHAVYMIFNTKPFEIIHMPIGDAWNADRCWLRGLRLSDAKQMVKSDKAMARLFGRR